METEPVGRKKEKAAVSFLLGSWVFMSCVVSTERRDTGGGSRTDTDSKDGEACLVVVVVDPPVYSHVYA